MLMLAMMVLFLHLLQSFFYYFQKDLDEVVLEWSVHKIRSSKKSNSPLGRPCIMYEMPSLYNTKSYLLEVPSFALEALVEKCKFNKLPCDEDFYQLTSLLMIENGLTEPNDPNEATNLYTDLRRILKELFPSNEF